MHYIKRGSGRPLLLIHGLGESWKSWEPVLKGLTAEREVIAIDLPGFGKTPPLSGESSVRTLADAVTDFLEANNLIGVDAVGISMGGRLVLELVRRGGILGAVVSLDPGGFWEGWERHTVFGSLFTSIRITRLSRPFLPLITASVAGRIAMLAQLCARPWQVTPKLASDELAGYASSPVIDEVLYNLFYGEEQQGAPKNSIQNTLVIGWGKKDKICLPQQAKRALAKFPDATLYWFQNSGHLPIWDCPEETIKLILNKTGSNHERINFEVENQ